ncbi:MAG: purine-nucleoside phosphorylase [Proteobacteria bacterium]|nr:purine-nucleoside phosphorylase [Pseudomonadota bacterium]MBS0573155.1 purine-nucleoside phosphorylase [Pseudomonadota bacterium]
MQSATIRRAADHVRRHFPQPPEIALVLGSGLGALADRIDGPRLPYGDIPGFPVSTAPGHAGVLCLGELFGRRVVAMQGRVHMYEGYSAAEVVFPVRMMAELGAHTAVFTNAAGGIGAGHAVGDLVLIEDHLSLAVAAGLDPTRGAQDAVLGPRFTSLNKAYDPDLLALAGRLQPGLRRAVYAHNVGPSFEPPALIRLFAAMGCGLVGMSTVPEVIAARQAGQKVLALSAVTNLAVSDTADAHVTSEEEVWEAVKIAQPRLLSFMERLIPALPPRAA